MVLAIAGLIVLAVGFALGFALGAVIVALAGPTEVALDPEDELTEAEVDAFLVSNGKAPLYGTVSRNGRRAD